VSDHGFAPIHSDVNLAGAFIKAGLITVSAEGKVSDWQAEPWFSGGSAAIVLAHPEDTALEAKVGALLAQLKADPNNGIDRVVSRKEIEKMGGASTASFYVNFKIGYEMGKNPLAPLVSPSTLKGMHGYFPTAPEMLSTFLISGTGISRHGSLGLIDMRDIAPTLAKELGVKLENAQGKARL
jgi:predicted AlkP superfamily pyrophosphatase or phosphodiesterase